MNGQIQIQEPHLLIVEGEDDRRLLDALIREESLSGFRSSPPAARIGFAAF